MRSFVVLPGFNGVAAGQTASVSLPVGGITYHKLQLAYSCTNAGNGSQANFEAHITEMRLKLNGKIQRRFSAKDLDTINNFYNRALQTLTPVGGVLNAFAEVYFSKPWARSPQGEDSLAWGMADVASFQIEADIAAAATGPSLVAHAEVEYVSRPTGIIEKWRKFNQVVGAVGHNINNTLPKLPGEAYAEIHTFPTNVTDIMDVTVTVDNVIRFQANISDNAALLHGAEGVVGWNANAEVFPIIFNRTGRVSDALPIAYTQNGKLTGQVVQDFKIDFNMNAANSFNLITVVLGNRD
jgi:hypothetical protein